MTNVELEQLVSSVKQDTEKFEAMAKGLRELQKVIVDNKLGKSGQGMNTGCVKLMDAFMREYGYQVTSLPSRER